MLCASDTWKVTCPFTMGWEVSSLAGTCSCSCPGPNDDCKWLLACPWERWSMPEVCRLLLSCGRSKGPASGEGARPLWWRWDRSPAAATGKWPLSACSWPQPTTGEWRELLAWGWDSCAEELALLLKLLKETCPATGECTLLLFCLWHREKERLITVIFSLELKGILFSLKLAQPPGNGHCCFSVYEERERERKRKTDFQSGTKGDIYSPKIRRQCLIVGSTLSVNNFSTNIFLKHDNDYFEPELVTASYWNSGNEIPWPTDQWKFWGNQQGTNPRRNALINLVINESFGDINRGHNPWRNNLTDLVLRESTGDTIPQGMTWQT